MFDLFLVLLENLLHLLIKVRLAANRDALTAIFGRQLHVDSGFFHALDLDRNMTHQAVLLQFLGNDKNTK